MRSVPEACAACLFQRKIVCWQLLEWRLRLLSMTKLKQRCLTHLLHRVMVFVLAFDNDFLCGSVLSGSDTLGNLVTLIVLSVVAGIGRLRVPASLLILELR